MDVEKITKELDRRIFEVVQTCVHLNAKHWGLVSVDVDSDFSKGTIDIKIIIKS